MKDILAERLNKQAKTGKPAADKRKRPTKPKESEPTAVAVPAVSPAKAKSSDSQIKPYRAPKGRYPHQVALNVSVVASGEAREALQGAHQAGEYTYRSVSDLVRTALAAYFQESLALQQPVSKGRKTKLTFSLDDELKAQYDELPDGCRGEIVERALRTFVDRYF